MVNLTNLAGEYKLDLHWTPTEQTGSVRTLKDPEFLRALEKQCGLQLKKRKALYDVLVVDHAAHLPSEN